MAKYEEHEKPPKGGWPFFAGQSDEVLMFLKGCLDREEKTAKAVRPLRRVWAETGEEFTEATSLNRLTYSHDDGHPHMQRDREAYAQYRLQSPEQTLVRVRAMREMVWVSEGKTGLVHRRTILLLANAYEGWEGWKAEWKWKEDRDGEDS